MPKSDYVKKADLAFAQQMLQFKNNIGAYKTVLGLSDVLRRELEPHGVRSSA